MDIYQSTIDYVSKLQVMQSWPELQTLFTRTAKMKPRYWLLPMQACEAVGGSIAESVPAVTAIACAQMSILLIDDMLDEDPRGEYHQSGHAKVANYAAGLQAVAAEAFCSNEVQLDVRLPGLCSLNQMVLMTAWGQHLDVQNPLDEAEYWRVTQNKSAPFFGAAIHLGALAGKASDQIAGELKQFGRLYGEMIQIHDDLNDTMAQPASPDWLQKRTPLPILFGQVVEHPERARFLELRQNITQPGALAEAQDILIRCGAVSYCIDQLLRRFQLGRKMLRAIPLAERDTLDNLLEEVISPVYRLFRETGTPLPDHLVPIKAEALAV